MATAAGLAGDVDMITPKIKRIINRDGRTRIEAYREHHRRQCVSDYRIRRLIAKQSGGRPFDHIRFRVGSVVRSVYAGGGLWFVVGHAYTGPDSTERGCYACRITDRILRRWQWIGPEPELLI